MMTKRFNNPNHYTIITSSEKNQIVRATKKTKGKKKKQNTSMDVLRSRLLESHTTRTANRFSIGMLLVFGWPLFCNSPRIDALECLVFTIYKGPFNYLTAFGSRKQL